MMKIAGLLSGGVRRCRPQLHRLLSARVPALRPPVAVWLGTGLTSATLLALTPSAPQCRSSVSSTIEEADRLFASNEYEKLAAVLRATIASGEPTDAELLWRLGRACKKLADTEKPKSPAKEALIREALDSAKRALALRAECGPAHKWYAILLSELGEFEGTTATIKNSFVVREHFEKAVALSPDDATSRHLLGLWCFEVAKLSWIEKKAAAALFASPPSATFEEAIAHFERAEKMDPGFYPKNMLMLARAYSKLGNKAAAADWRNRCLAAKALTPEDEQTQQEAKQFQP